MTTAFAPTSPSTKPSNSFDSDLTMSMARFSAAADRFFAELQRGRPIVSLPPSDRIISSARFELALASSSLICKLYAPEVD